MLTNFEIIPGSSEHFGEKCLIGCNDQEGNCDWCGDDGLCCKKGSIGNGCDGTIGGTNDYLCVNKHGNIQPYIAVYSYIFF